MKNLFNKLHPGMQGVLLGCLISFLVVAALPPVVMLLRWWWFDVWGMR